MSKGVSLLHNQEAGALGFMERDVPGALVSYLGRQQFAIYFYQLDIHLHIKTKNPIAIPEANIAPQNLKSTGIENGRQFFNNNIIVADAWLAYHPETVHRDSIEIFTAGKLVEVILPHVFGENLRFAADERYTSHFMTRRENQCL